MRKERLGGKEIEKACVDLPLLYGSFDEQALAVSECPLKRVGAPGSLSVVRRGWKRKGQVGEEAGDKAQVKHQCVSS